MADVDLTRLWVAVEAVADRAAAGDQRGAEEARERLSALAEALASEERVAPRAVAAAAEEADLALAARPGPAQARPWWSRPASAVDRAEPGRADDEADPGVEAAAEAAAERGAADRPAGLAWWEGVAPVTALVAVAGGHHRLGWSVGRVHVLDHGDVAGERGLAALGAARCPCVALADHIGAAGADTRLLTLTSRAPGDEPRATVPPDPEPSLRRWETVDQGLGGGGRAAEHRAWLAAHAVLSLPGAFQRRLALHAAHRALRAPAATDPVATARLCAALVVRAQRALEASLAAAGYDQARAAVVVAASRPAAVAVEGGGDRVRVSLPVRWLVDVWGRDLGVDGDRFVAAVDGWAVAGRAVSGRAIRWRGGKHQVVGVVEPWDNADGPSSRPAPR